jgi:hypothetical protein
LPKFQLPSLPKPKLPKFKLPSLPKLQLPNISGLVESKLKFKQNLFKSQPAPQGSTSSYGPPKPAYGPPKPVYGAPVYYR